LEEAKLSRTVLADFAQLTPERAALVTADPYAPGRLRVVISGPAPRGPRPQSFGLPRPSAPVTRPTIIRVTVQERDPAVQSDLGWRPAPAVSEALAALICGGTRAGEQAWNEQPEGTFAVCAKPQGASPNDPDLALWDGVVRFRLPLQPSQYRLLIEEYEYQSADYTVVVTAGRRRRVEQPGRLIYAETILLDEALLAGPAAQAGRTELDDQ
jgi:hypothetical protein